ncbi:MAG: MEKHLA domain-containing protein [Methylophilaceae bacterium]|nr:MEKHLA domain-containing protein [Methylophilaceae bacterium]
MPDLVFLQRHTHILCASYQHWIGQPLLQNGLQEIASDVVQQLMQAPFALVSHGTEADPIFNYANLLALQLFGMTWEEFTGLPSRYSAEPLARAERASLLERVERFGFIDDYCGVRIAKGGQRFKINQATVWNLLDENGQHYGQAALIRDWQAL